MFFWSIWHKVHISNTPSDLFGDSHNLNIASPLPCLGPGLSFSKVKSNEYTIAAKLRKVYYFNPPGYPVFWFFKTKKAILNLDGLF